MKNIWKFIAVLILVTVFLRAYPVKAEEQKTVRVAYFDGTGDFVFDGNGEVCGGYSYDYIMKMATIEGWKIDFVKPESSDLNDAILEMMDKLAAGTVDMLGTTYYSPEFEEVYAYPDNNYGNAYTTLLARGSQSDMVLQNNKESFRVAVYEKAKTKRAELQDYCKALNIQYEEVVFQTEKEQYDALCNGSVDFMLSVSLKPYPNTKVVAEFAGRPFYLITGKENTQLATEIDHAIETIKYTEPEYQELLHEKYYLPKTEGITYSADEEVFITQHPVLSVLIPEENAPFLTIGENGTCDGIFISFIDYFSKETGIKINVYVKPESMDLKEAAATGKYDVILGVEQNYETAAEQGLMLSKSLVDSSMVLFYNRGTDISDLSQLVMARQLSLAGKNLGVSGRFEEYSSLYECLEAIERGEADFGYGTALEVNYLMNRDGYRSIASVPVLMEGEEYSLAFPINTDKELVSIVNKVIRNIGSDQLNAFISESGYSGNEKTLAAYLRDNPIQAAIVFSAFMVMMAVAVMFYIFAQKSKKQKIVLEKANNAKNDFLSRMSHDMRTPMNAIIGISSLGMQDAKEAEIKEYFGNIKVSGDYLLKLINDVLEMAKIERNANMLYEEPIELADLLEQINVTVVSLCRKKDIIYEFQMGENNEGMILVDYLRFCQIMLNILSNAVKFTPAGGRIKFTITDMGQEEGRVCKCFQVEDSGIGMSSEFLNHLFEPFVQEHAIEVGTNEGSGLGLSIVENFVRMMKGAIDVKSEKGVGTSITVRLSFSRYIKEAEKKDLGVTEDMGLAGMRVLLCEDHPLNTKIAEKILKKEGIEVVSAENGEVGMEAFVNSTPGYFDVILMDIRMPVMDGLETAKLIRNMEREDAGSIPIIAMTANACEDDRKKSQEAGMNEHLTKPIVPDVLYRTLRNYKQ